LGRAGGGGRWTVCHGDSAAGIGDLSEITARGSGMGVDVKAFHEEFKKGAGQMQKESPTLTQAFGCLFKAVIGEGRLTVAVMMGGAQAYTHVPEVLKSLDAFGIE